MNNQSLNTKRNQFRRLQTTVIRQLRCTLIINCRIVRSIESYLWPEHRRYLRRDTRVPCVKNIHTVIFVAQNQYLNLCQGNQQVTLKPVFLYRYQLFSRLTILLSKSTCCPQLRATGIGIPNINQNFTTLE